MSEAGTITVQVKTEDVLTYLEKYFTPIVSALNDLCECVDPETGDGYISKVEWTNAREALKAWKDAGGTLR